MDSLHHRTRSGQRPASSAGRIGSRAPALLVIALGLSLTLAGCSELHGDLFPNAPNNSFINTPAIGSGPAQPTTPVSGHTTNNPTGR